MPLPAPHPRSLFHTRQVVFHGYHREDGLWDLEARLHDSKSYSHALYGRPSLPPGEPVHDLSIRLTVDDDFLVREIATSMDATPFGECQQARPPMEQFVGAKLGPGWRQAIERILGGVQGCTHLRELLFNMATAAYQTIPAGQAHLQGQPGIPPTAPDQPPYHVGRCIAWDVDGTVVQRHYPQFVGWAPLRHKPRTQG